MSSIFKSPLFGISLTIIAFVIGTLLSKKIKSPLVNPLIVATILCVTVMKVFGISYKDYMVGGQFISMFIVPATAVLGLSIFRQKKILKEQFFPIIVGCGLGSMLSMGSTVVLCQLFHIHQEILHSLLPKSITTAIAMDLSAQLGGIPSVTMLAVLLCGIFGAIINPILIKLFHITDPVAIGVGMGTASHAVGTAKAIEMGEIEGAVSGVSIGVAGICTVIITLFL
ncbi:MAG: LrgB family protein [Lachnospiraceae bacterium]|nr:LrgB family protein [Lachnospiraceae bacterium]